VTPDELNHYKTALNGIVMVGVVALSFLLFSANLNVIHPALAGIVLIAVVLWMVLSLWRSGRALAAEISRGASELGKRLEERSKQTE
jgi:K+ transporter